MAADNGLISRSLLARGTALHHLKNVSLEGSFSCQWIKRALTAKCAQFCLLRGGVHLHLHHVEQHGQTMRACHQQSSYGQPLPYAGHQPQQLLISVPACVQKNILYAYSDLHAYSENHAARAFCSHLESLQLKCERVVVGAAATCVNCYDRLSRGLRRSVPLGRLAASQGSKGRFQP